VTSDTHNFMIFFFLKIQHGFKIPMHVGQVSYKCRCPTWKQHSLWSGPYKCKIWYSKRPQQHFP